MKVRTLVFVAALLLGGALAQNAFEGDWEGVVGPDSLNLSVIVHFETTPDGLSGTVDIPAQGARGLTLEISETTDDTVVFAIAETPGDPTFSGELADDDLILGTFTQGGQDLPFRLERRVDVPEEPRFVEAFLGSWAGVIGPDSLALEVSVTFEEVDGVMVGRITIPAQGFEGLLDVRATTEQTINFVIEGVPGNPTFEATLAENELQGTFTQGEETFPFTLAKSGPTAETGSASEGETGGAAALDPKEALERFLTTRPLQAEWFADSFLAQVPLAQLEPGLEGITSQLGTYERVEGDSSPFTVKFSQGTATVTIVLDSDGKISTLFIGNPVPDLGSVDEAVAKIAELPGQTSVIVLKNGEEVASTSADMPLGVGSAFKLAVLSALQDQVAAGTRSWDEVFDLKPEWKSLPSGILQNWPDGTPLTLQTLATLMISVSDNTATDALISVVGREAVEAKAERNRPFLTTQELFKLKTAQNSDLLERFLTGDEAGKRQVLTELADLPLPAVESLTDTPAALEAEWFFTPGELCQLMAEVQALPLMSVNPGLANAADWQRVAYKGGSEPGVLNLTSWLTGEDGTTYCVVVTQNNPNAPLDETGLAALYGGLLGALE